MTTKMLIIIHACLILLASQLLLTAVNKYNNSNNVWHGYHSEENAHTTYLCSLTERETSATNMAV